MKNLFNKNKNKSFYGERFKTIICAGKAAGIGDKALKNVLNQINSIVDSKYSITLTCGKLVTGVTVKQ